MEERDMYHTILFDLDGTLTDSGPGITNSVAYALRKWDIEEKDMGILRKFVGPPLDTSFAKYYGFSEEQCRQAILYYREYYLTKGIYENRVYDGIEDLLKWLKASGRRVIVATSKPEPSAIHVLEHFGIAPYFDIIAGATMEDRSRVEKSDVIRYALERAGIRDTAGTVMVGDRENDMQGAKDNGLSSIGVLYGYGSREELEEAGALQLAETVEDVRRCIERLENK